MGTKDSQTSKKKSLSETESPQKRAQDLNAYDLQPDLGTVIQRAKEEPGTLGPIEVLKLQHTIGNHQVTNLLQRQGRRRRRRRRQREGVDPAYLVEQLSGLTTRHLMALFADSFLSGEREEGLEGIPRAYTRSFARENSARIDQILQERFPVHFQTEPAVWFNFYRYIHVQLEPPAARSRLYIMLRDSQQGQPIPPEARPRSNAELDDLYSRAIRSLRASLATVRIEVYRRSNLDDILSDTQALAQFTAALQAYPRVIQNLMGDSSGLLPVEQGMAPDSPARQVRGDIAAAEAARAAWRGLGPERQIGLRSNRRATRRALNESILAHTRWAADRANISPSDSYWATARQQLNL